MFKLNLRIGLTVPLVNFVPLLLSLYVDWALEDLRTIWYCWLTVIAWWLHQSMWFCFYTLTVTAWWLHQSMWLCFYTLTVTAWWLHQSMWFCFYTYCRLLILGCISLQIVRVSLLLVIKATLCSVINVSMIVLKHSPFPFSILLKVPQNTYNGSPSLLV